MPRIPQSQIDEIKQSVSLVRLVESRGVELKKHGQDQIGRCPFHHDKTPSFVISPKNNLWHCLGACSEGGSVIDFIMKIDGVSFRHAVELLVNSELPSLPVEVNHLPKIIKRNSTPKLSNPLAANSDNQTALTQVVDYYHETLKSSSEALDYLESRGLKNKELIDTFKIGYANRTLAYRLPQKNRAEGANIRGQLQEIGIIRKSGHEHFNGSIIVPVADENKIITEVYGRKINNNLRKGTPSHLYLPGSHEGVWNVAALKASKEIILCEALIDAMAFWVNGFRNVTASYGTSGFTDSHLAAFKRYKTERVLIAYDRDEAGNTAAEKLAKQLNQRGIDCFRINFPKNMDAAEYALRMTPANKSLGLVIRSAEWIGSGQPPERQFDLEDLDSEIVEVVDKESGEVINVEPETIPALEKASPLPKPPKPTIEAQVNDEETIIGLSGRRYRIRGLNKNQQSEQLKINLLISLNDLFYVDSLDLYSARHRNAYIKQAAVELCLSESVIKSDCGKILLKLEELQDKKRKEALAVKDPKPVVEEKDRLAALDLLKDENLLERILSDFNQAGIVGERTNKLIGYLAACSRKLDRPLAVMVQSSSAAGKSALMDSVLNFMPEEERVQYSAMTGQALFYMGEQDLKHKILAIAEEEGADNASYALKLLQSEGEVSIASTGKNATTGNLETQTHKVEGPVMLFSTTTAIDIDEELMNRCLVLSVDESREQTSAIHEQQRARRTLAGRHAKIEKDKAIQLHQNAQRLLRPLQIINPYADQLTFINDKTRTRRDHEKYLTLIDTIALLHQYQRVIKKDVYKGIITEYVTVELSDIEAANQLANEVLGQTLDELPPQTRRMLKVLHKKVVETCEQEEINQCDHRFSRQSLRQDLGWTYDQVRVHLERLVKLEHVLIHKGGRGQSFNYELLYDGKGAQGEAFLNGLINVEKLKKATQNKPTTKSLGSKSSQVGVALGGRWGENGVGVVSNSKPDSTKATAQIDNKTLKNAHLANKKTNVSPVVVIAE